MTNVFRQSSYGRSKCFGIFPLCVFIFCLGLLFVTPIHALIEMDQLSKPDLSVRYRQLIEEYRCPKCQNQNLAGSDSPISADLRREIRRMLEEGASDEQISDYLVARYGDFIRYRPRFQDSTYLLWLGPGLLLVIGLSVAGLVIRRQRSVAAFSEKLGSERQGSKRLNHEEQQRLDDLLAEPKTLENGEDGNSPS